MRSFSQSAVPNIFNEPMSGFLLQRRAVRMIRSDGG